MSLKPFSETIDEETTEPKKNLFQEPQVENEVLRPFSEDIYGGLGSGHHGHEGREGKVGGSQPGEGTKIKEKDKLTFEQYKKRINDPKALEPPYNQDWEQRLEKEEEIESMKSYYNVAKELGIASAKDKELAARGEDLTKETWKKLGSVYGVLQSKPENLTPEQTAAFRKGDPKLLEEVLSLARDREKGVTKTWEKDKKMVVPGESENGGFTSEQRKALEKELFKPNEINRLERHKIRGPKPGMKRYTNLKEAVAKQRETGIKEEEIFERDLGSCIKWLGYVDLDKASGEVEGKLEELFLD